MAVSEVDISHYAPRFDITVNGKDFPAEISKRVLSVSVKLELNKTNSFSFVFQDELVNGKHKWLGNELFKLGNNVFIKIGYTAQVHQIIEGKIQNISAKYFEGTAPTFTVDGSDGAFEILMLKGAPKVFKDKSDSDIAEKIAGIAHLEHDIDPTETVYKAKTKKGGKSYFDFLIDMAAANGYEFYIDERKMFFGKARKNQEEILTLTWGKDIISFSPTINTTQAVSEVIVRSWDATGKKQIEGRAKAGDESTQEAGKLLSSQIVRDIYGDVVKVITDQVVTSVDEANKLAKSKLDKLSDGLLKCSGVTIGLPEIKPAVCIRVDGIGPLFSGKYFVEKATHTIDGNGYRTKFDARRNSL